LRRVFSETGSNWKDHCLYECGWHCSGSCSCENAYHNSACHASKSSEYVHKWHTSPTRNGDHWHSFAVVRAPRIQPPDMFPQPPTCSTLSQAPSEEYIKDAMNEDAQWAAWIKEEDQLQKIADERRASGKRAWLKEKKSQAIKTALSDLDCPMKYGWTTKIDEGSAIIARCGGGTGSHTLQLSSLVDSVVRQGLDRDDFEQYVINNKHVFVGKDVNSIVAGYVETVSLPEDPQLESEWQAMDKQAQEMSRQEKQQRMDAMTLQLQNRREENAEKINTKWTQEQIERPEWLQFLKQAQTWVETCETLHKAWDKYDGHRKVLEEQLGTSGFSQRPSVPEADPMNWDDHPVLRHASHNGYGILSRRWSKVSRQSVQHD